MGPILFNPGGPGGSGVDQILQRGDQFATVIGPQFDMVGFDPRGKCPSYTIYLHVNWVWQALRIRHPEWLGSNQKSKLASGQVPKHS